MSTSSLPDRSHPDLQPSESPERPRPEYPRPEAARDPWINLNGEWDFGFDPENMGEQKRWYRETEDYLNLKIVVPYPWESKLSGVCAPKYRGAGWYRKQIEIPEEWLARGLHPILRFGAVDWNAKVWVNGRFAAEHDGGYSPFEVDLHPFVTGKIKPASSGTGTSPAAPLRPFITVRAWDVCAADTPLGKQVKEWYTPSSGIWQTVWLEGRDPCHVANVHFSADLDRGVCCARVFLQVDEPGEYEVSFESPAGAFPGTAAVVDCPLGSSECSLEIEIPDVHLWRPEDPYLYEVRVRLAADGRVRDSLNAYFGMRSISRGSWGGSDHEYVLLNGEPVYLRGVLDQAFHPDALHSYPTDDCIRADVQAARDLGFNLLRCHIKVNDPRYYYWADRLGMMVMSDIPSTKLYSPVSRKNWEQTFRDAVARDFNHPCIIAWILFNETWGLEEHETEAGWTWVKEMYRLSRALDPTRLAEDNSACLYDHVATDLNSWHFYINDYGRARRHVNNVVASTLPGSKFNYVGGEYVQNSEPLLNSEYGGIGARDGDRDIAYCFKYLTAELRRHSKIVGYVYTELADIEWEHNGLLNYDRTEKEFGYGSDSPLPMTPADINSADFIGFDAPPCQTAAPGASVTFPLFFSHFGPRPISSAVVHWTARFCTAQGSQHDVSRGSIEFSPKRFEACGAGDISLTLPQEPGLLFLGATVVTRDSQPVARHYVQVEVHDPALPAAERKNGAWALRWLPTEFSASEWADVRVSSTGQKLIGRSYGSVEYEIAAPEDLDLMSARSIRLLFEAGAATALRRLEWKDRLGRINYPQTHQDEKFPGTLVVSLNGVTAGTVTLADDPADARGVLSHHNEQDRDGSYGALVDLTLDSEQTQAVLSRMPSRIFTVRLEVPRGPGRPGGLCLYGPRAGRYPVGPTLLIETGG